MPPKRKLRFEEALSTQDQSLDPLGNASGSASSPYASTSPAGGSGGSREPLRKKLKNGLRLTNFCFTIFPKSAMHMAKLWNWFQTKHGYPKWFVVGKEVCPTTQKLHLQG